MKRNGMIGILMVLICACGVPAHAVSKEMIELQERVQLLANQIAGLQQSFDGKLAALQANTDQIANNVKQISNWAAHVDATLKQQTADSDTCADQISGSSKALREQLEDLRAKLDMIAKQLHELNAPPASNSPAAAPERGENPALGKATRASDTTPR